MNDNFTTIYANLPTKVKGFILYDTCDDYYTIILNARHSYYQNIKTFFHELKHISRQDFIKRYSVETIETQCHSY